MSEEGCFPVKVRQNTPSEYIIVQMTASYLLMTSGTVQASITSHEYDHFKPSLQDKFAKEQEFILRVDMDNTDMKKLPAYQQLE